MTPPITMSATWRLRLARFDANRAATWMGLIMLCRSIPYLLPELDVYRASPIAASGIGYWIESEVLYGVLTFSIGASQLVLPYVTPSEWQARGIVGLIAAAYWMYTASTSLGASGWVSPVGWMAIPLALAGAYGAVRAFWRL